MKKSLLEMWKEIEEGAKILNENIIVENYGFKEYMQYQIKVALMVSNNLDITPDDLLLNTNFAEVFGNLISKAGKSLPSAKKTSDIIRQKIRK